MLSLCPCCCVALLVREHAVTAIAVIAGVLDLKFMKYYEQVMPIMKSIISACDDRKQRNLRGKAIECISIIGLSVGRDAFLKDGQEAMGAMLYLLGSGLEDDDPVKDYLQEAMGRMCKTMQQSFVPYLPSIVPNLLAVLHHSPNEIDQEEEEEDDMTMVMVAGGKCVGLKTSLIEEQERALDMLASFIEVLGPNFGQFIDPTTEALLPLISYVLSEEVKQKSLHAMSAIIQASRLSLEESGSTDRSHLHKIVSSTSHRVFNNMDEADVGAAEMTVEATGLVECLDRAGPNILPANHIHAMSDKVLAFVEKSTTRRSEIASRLADDTCDEEDIEAINEEKDEEQQLRTSLLEILGILMKHHPDEVTSVCSRQLSEFMSKNLLSSESDDDKAIGLYVLCDALEHLKERLWTTCQSFLSVLIESCNHDNMAVRRAAAYGVSQACKLQGFAVGAAAANRYLMAALSRPDAVSSRDQRMCTDNVVGALGDVIFRYGDSNNSVKGWLDYLPLKEDLEEAKRVHGDLVRMMEENNPLVLGNDNSNLSQLVGVLANIYKTESSDTDIDEKIRRMVQVLGGGALQGMEQSLTPAQRSKLEQIFTDSTSAGDVVAPVVGPNGTDGGQQHDRKP
eukprot:GHVS01056648.1.p1 GENE.GHVS01056648.1~~GHVS01056648.1.p1  ORF type:complete len:623 (+),score=97.40 GHVS01056648.1:2240-4108(+)